LDIGIFLVVALERGAVRRFAQYSGGFPRRPVGLAAAANI
jgi:hypothetical protein